MPEKEDQVYFEYRHHLVEARRQSYEQFDKAIFLLAGGALTVSLALIKDIVPFKTANYKPLLACAWLLFTIPLVLTLISFICSRRAIDQQLKNTEDYFCKNDKSAIERKNSFLRITEIINYSSAGSFILGLASFLVFVYVNLF